MLFNSLEFALFLPLVFLLYWHVFQRSLRLQNALIAIVSCIFYGWWDYRFLLLIGITTLTCYVCGLQIARYQGSGDEDSSDNKKPSPAKIYLAIAIILNISILFVFKYYNFFVSSFSRLFGYGADDFVFAKIILPVGISFYTFQALSYCIDVYQRKIPATRDFVQFATFIAFFPQLVAGPIERAANLLPQFGIKRTFSYPEAVDGCRQILLGLFKKMVVADNCSRYVDLIWRNHETFSGSTLVWGSIVFAFQIYGDFSGYSDIAIGAAKLFGIKLSTNFRTPYFSKNIVEFWRRWHISLNTWFKDYIYIPLGGNRQGRFNTLRNMLIVFSLSGLWHGANWTFVTWGLWHGLLSLLYILWHPTYARTLAKSAFFQKPLMQKLETLLLIALTFAEVCLGWILFRAPDIATAWVYISRCFSMSFFSLPMCKIAALYIFPLVIVEWVARKQPHALHYIPIKSWHLRWIFYIITSWIILDFDGGQSTFIYFQF